MINSPEGPSVPRPRSIPIPGVRPVLTFVILAITCAVFLGQTVLGDSFTYYGLKVNALIRQGELWRLVTPIFFHAGIMHIFFNMYALYIIGPQVERPLGYSKFLVIYFLSGICGVFASFLFSPDYSLGASGAIFGLVGALAVFLYRNSRLFGSIGRNMLSNLLVIIVLNLAISLTPGIDLWGHLGGLLMGSFLALFLCPQWAIQADPSTGIPSIMDLNPFSERPTAVILCLTAVFLFTLWMGIR
jgi:rhomboid protease GluP